MFDSSKPYTFDRVVRIAIAAIIVYAIIYLLGYLSSVLVPFAIAALLAYLINPLTNFFHKKVKSRFISVLISLISIGGVLFLIGWLVIPLISKEIKYMVQLLQTLYGNLNSHGELSENLPKRINEFIANVFSSKEFQDIFNNESISGIAVEIGRKLLPGIVGIITGLITFISGLLSVAIVFLYLIFLLLYYDRINKGWKELLPEKFKVTVLSFVHEFEEIMNRYFRNQALVAGTVGVLFATGFGIIGLPMGILIGLMMGMLNMVPYLQILGYIPVAFSVGIYSLETGNSFWIMLGLATLVIAIVQIFQDSVLVPAIMGRVTGFNPAMILLSITIWGKLLGFLGLIIALPITYLLLAYYRKFVLGIIVANEVAEIPIEKTETKE